MLARMWCVCWVVVAGLCCLAQAAGPSGNDVDTSLPLYSIPSPMPLSPCVPGAPQGMFTLGSGNGLNGILDNVTFVDGYSWRSSWSSLEVAAGVYNFSIVDTLIATLTGINQKLSIDLTVSPDDPPYLVDGSSGASCIYNWTYSQDVLRVCPWDAVIQQAWKSFVSALASHTLPLSSTNPQLVALRDHPTLAALNLGVPGIGAVRFYSFQEPPITSIAGYTRAGFVNAVQLAAETQVSNFPNKAHMLGFWLVTDQTSEPPLWQSILMAFTTNFSLTPKVALFQENLSAHRNFEAARYKALHQSPLLLHYSTPRTFQELHYNNCKGGSVGSRILGQTTSPLLGMNSTMLTPPTTRATLRSTQTTSS